MKDQMKLNIDLKATQALKSPEGNVVFAEGVILRKVSKFLAGTAEDGIIPIPVFYDVKTGEILVETLPKDLRDEFKNESI
jgi:hypothetical protein